MASYIDQSLVGNETVLYRTKPTWWSAFWPIFWGILIGVFTGIGFLIMVPAIVRILTTEIGFTENRIIVKTGFISRDTLELALNRVEFLNVSQTITGRILRFGDIEVRGAGGHIKVIGIAQAQQFRRAFFYAQQDFGHRANKQFGAGY